VGAAGEGVIDRRDGRRPARAGAAGLRPHDDPAQLGHAVDGHQHDVPDRGPVALDDEMLRRGIGQVPLVPGRRHLTQPPPRGRVGLRGQRVGDI